jgi:hypothetical protein
MVSWAQENGFVPSLIGKCSRQNCDARSSFVAWIGDDSIMLEAIVLLLSVATCALILLAFWGLDLLRMRR